MKKRFLFATLMSSLSLLRSNAQSCLLDYQTRLDELLPKATIQKHVTGNWSDAKLKYRKSASKFAKYDTYEYVWTSGRTMKQTIGGRSIDLPDDNRIGVGWINEVNPKYHPDPLNYFKNFYRTATEAEKQKASELIEKKLSEKSPGDKAAGKAVSGVVMNHAGYEPIAGIGDAATWDLTSHQLIVLKGRITFQVISRIGTDMKANQALAKKLATEVLAKCPKS
ncbi:hypothetical protein GCM10028807_54960 [Spirosoma daeguense]